ncbi:hypothetical protein B484DRAFT_391373 [Ochromonadaceae sp. CCMP2298]|nr:hypothetical protein B484DRAFT_391373 [Ochromonadaceae sp. CCMP2298]|mmetsp:Transcript_5720/g.12596  ORF Transcript_5720/g.12596 Transcript_5720/m.12596 type:complete len:188 (+) Transcript_5720:112-675(+)
MDAEAADLERKLFEVNHLPKASLEAEFLRCCGSRAWGQAMIEKLPFTSYASLLDTASLVWWHLPVSEWQMAFSAHPQIGDAAALRSKFANSAWEGDEQKGANAASEETLRQLARLNTEYLDKQGFIFLICATGKSAAEMVVALQARMPNDSATEVQVAAGEQDKITKLRLRKLLDTTAASSSSISKL